MFTFKEIQIALERDEFFLEYMPTMSLHDKRCVGGEALIRWRKDGTVIPPAEFIPLIENTPLSGMITYWVIDTVSKELRSWLLEQDDVRISINVPPEIIGRGGIYYAANRSGLIDVADKLMLEVTERGLLDALGVSAITMSSEHDVLIALDDLAANDASLLVLSRAPACIVKLDKSFADAMLRSDWTDQKVAGISALINCGELRVIAEGIEKARQVEILKDVGIQMAQGLYFSSPLPVNDFLAYFANHH